MSSIDPIRRRDTAIIQSINARPRGLFAQARMVLLQPVLFFRLLPTTPPESRQWLWIGIIILVLVGVVTVRQAELTGGGGSPNGGDAGGGITAPGSGPAPILPGGGIVPGGGSSPAGGGGPAPDPGTSTPGTGATSDIATTWTTAIIGASGIVLGWLVLAIVLCFAPLIRARAPRPGLALQVAIWASLPLALMAGLQLLYYAAGGSMGSAGLVGLLPELPGYKDMPGLSQALLTSLASRFTLFWLWSLLLVYLGARFAMRGWRIAAWFVVIVWVFFSVVAPVATGAISIPQEELPPALTLPGEPETGPGSAPEIVPGSTPDATPDNTF